MTFVTGLRCRECGRDFPAEALHVCDFCFGPLEVAYDLEAVKTSITRERVEAGPKGIWRWADLLPAAPPGQHPDEQALVAPGGGGDALRIRSPTPQRREDGMEHRRLGTTGLKISRLGLGCGNFGGIGSLPEFYGKG